MACGRLIKDVWSGRDNSFRLRLDVVASDGTVTPEDLSGVLTVELLLGDAVLTVNVNDSNAGINWWDGSLDVGEMQFELGDFIQSAGLARGQWAAELVLYSAVYPDGIVWVSEKNRELLINALE